MRSLLLAAVSGLALAACSQPADTDADTTAAQTAETPASETAMSDAAETTNPLIAEWTGPYGGVPAFDQMDLGALREAMQIGMERARAEINAIADNPEPPTFENTIVAMERAGSDLDRVFVYYGIWSSNMSSPEFREIQREMAPILSAFSSETTQNEELFARIQAVHDGEEFFDG